MISKNLFAQADQYGQCFVLFDENIDAITDGTQINITDAFIHTKNGKKRKRETTKGWEICIQRKDGSSTGNQLKYVRESYPVQMEEYASENELSEEPAFV